MVVRLFVVLMVGLGGCAFIPDTVDLQYQSSTTLAPLPGASRVRVNTIANSARTGRPDQIGVKKNGYGMEMAPILSSRPIPDLVRDAISEELRKDGFELGSGDISVVAEVIKFSNDFKIGFFSGDAVSEIILNVSVRNSDGTINFAKSVVGTNSDGGVMLASGSNAKSSLEKSLSNAVAKLFADPAFTAALLRSRVPLALPNA